MKGDKYSGNNLLALLAIFLIIFSIWSFWITNRQIELTSRAAQGQVSICIGSTKKVGKLVIENPLLDEIVSGNYTIRSYGGDNPESLYAVRFFILPGTPSYLGNVTQSDGLYFNFMFNTSKYPDLNCGYRIMGRGFFRTCYETGTSEAVTNFFTINNNDTPPIWNNFKNRITTNFSQFSSWIAIPDVRIGIPGKGLIYFFNSTINLDGANLDSRIIFGNRSLFIGSIPCVTSRLASLKPIVTFTNISLYNPQLLRNGTLCSITSCERLGYSRGGNYSFRILSSGTANYSLIEGSHVVMSIFDDTDGIRDYYVNQEVGFYANLTDVVTKSPIYGSGVYCYATFNLNYEARANLSMSYNPSLRLWEFRRSFPHPNLPGYNDQWGAYCNAKARGLGETPWQFDTFEIVNRAPVQIADLPNETWAWNTVLIGRRLLDYFVDPDNDPINFSIQRRVDNIQVLIDPNTSIVSFIPSFDWYGNRTVVFIAKDPFNLTAISNEVWLEVVKTPTPEPKKPSEQVVSPPPGCKPDWVCGNWSNCLPSGIQKRSCIDKNNCEIPLWTPEVVRNCTYIPTCFDKIKNQNEEGVDCGGNCPPCPTCSDGIRNQGETGVDCGGPCLPCPTCFDGILNQGEEMIDCGGPCQPCPTCSDGIQNQGEEGVDCGGPCPACQKVFALDRPGVSRAFWSIFLMSLFAGLGIAILVRSQIRSLIESIVGWLKGLLTRKPTTSLFDAYIMPYLKIEQQLDSLKSSAATWSVIREVLEPFFVFIFGEAEAEQMQSRIKIAEEFSGELRERIGELHKKVFLEIPEAEYGKLIDFARAVVRSTFIETFVTSGMSLSEVLDSMLGLFPKILKEDAGLAQVLKTEAYMVYNMLPMELKAKVYKRIREIDKTEVKSTPESNPKAMAFFVVLGLMALFGIIFGPAFTGYFVASPEKLRVLEIENIELGVGERLEINVEVNGGSPPYTFFDDSDYFDIEKETGKISLVADERMLGRNFATIWVKDASGSIAYGRISFMVHR